MDMTQARSLFIDEANSLLADMERFLLEIEAGDATSAQHIDAIFRAAHTIKGSAGLFGFDHIVAFTHNVESVLDKVRSGQLELDGELINLMLQCQDHTASLIRQLEDESSGIDLVTGTALIKQLHLYLDPAPVVIVAPTAALTHTEHWQLDVHYGEDVFRDGMDPLSQLHYLQSLGELKQVRLVPHWPAPAAFDPESCYLQLKFELASTATKQQIADVFEFVQDNSKVQISPPNQIKASLDALPTVDEKLGTLLVNAGAVTERELQSALSSQKEHDNNQALGQVLVDQGAVSPEMVAVALDKQKATEHKRPADFQFLKVEARKLDELINLVGELVTAGAGIDVLVQEIANEKLKESFSVLTGLLEQIRDGALGLRMVQVGESFSRLRRIVRDVSKELGKDIELTVEGADTELDKSMVEKLSDPLMHIVRNALDHGIESKELRLYKGKPAQGQLKLSACHEAGSVVIEIADDGAGLNIERIRAKAIEKNIISADQELAEEDIYKLIFAPGFSTAAAVTNLSGRGVGMDVVKRNIEELRGQIQISSVPDQGTVFRIRLPLTLAIIDGFLVSVAGTHLVLPLNMVQECIEFQMSQQDNERNYLDLRGEVLPFIRLRQLFDLAGPPQSRENIVVVQYGKHRAGLVVDHLHGELQAVIKPLNTLFRSLRGIGGYTILGSGNVGLILDIPQLVQFATNLENQSFVH
ncbi:hypothetical protein A5320_11400 [Rheinheimera sp. SA_1]|uniref:chemotaxis protein CheA n=1 Tax=Rheinheimera sp. SA_1 TaxID=1827365 RepID=UPI0007FC673A|nr:chemotaxis protein CheA [Rheinheimera sp. SA_1]OBP14378.1 hypothetical protein A5320_11400 [Rheinheimera sp. SA_1]